jgi:hypothetical protein
MTLKLELDMFIRWQGDPSREAIGGSLEFGATMVRAPDYINS